MGVCFKYTDSVMMSMLGNKEELLNFRRVGWDNYNAFFTKYKTLFKRLYFEITGIAKK